MALLLKWLASILILALVYWFFFLKDHCVWVGNYLIGGAC